MRLSGLLFCRRSPQARKHRAAIRRPPNSTTGIPTFHAHARQVIVEADVWKPVDKKHPDADWVPERAVAGAPDGAGKPRKVLRLMPPPAQGLTAKDFRVFDNGAEQEINYFRGADFPAVGTTAGLWRFAPTTSGNWGTLLFGSGVPYAPSATYMIERRLLQQLTPENAWKGYTNICRSSPCMVANRKEYCPMKNSEPVTTLETKLRARMQEFASSSAPGTIKVSALALAFWSSGVLSLARQVPSTEVSSPSPGTDFTYVVEVHDSKAPTTVQIATQFTLPYLLWNAPCPKNAAIYVLGTV